jgi:GntR family transcriptional regulator, transcriptional repressor for pyruvate dehydrogenase complex
MSKNAVIPFQPVEKTSAVEAVERRLRTDILNGKLRPGDKLPPERELAVALGVNRLTLRAALGRLAAAGLLETQHGEGNRVLDYQLSAGLERLPELTEAFLSDGPMVEKLVSDLLDLRRAVLSEAVTLAAQRARPKDLRLLHALVAEQHRRIVDERAFIEGDLELSRLLLRASGNLAFELIFNTIVRFARAHPDLYRLIFEDRALMVRGYEGLLGILESGETDVVRENVRAALAYQDENIMEAVRTYVQGKPKRQR